MWIDPRRRLIAVYLTNYGEPQPFTESDWDQLVTAIAPDRLFDLVTAATR